MTTIKRRPKPYPRHTGAVVQPKDVPPKRAAALDPYIEETIANPERINNGCQIYKRGAE